MKRILFLVNHDVVIYNFRLEIVEALLKDGHEVHISSPYGERIDDLVNLGCIYHEVDIARHGTNPISELKLIGNYRKLLKSVKPDMVFSYTIKPNIYGGIACKGLKIPYVANITGLGTAVENPGLMQKLTVLLYKLSFGKVQRIYFQNEENKAFFEKHNIYCDKHDLLPGSGVNLQRFVPLDYPSDETIEFVFISRIMKEKGIDHYLEAAEYITKKYPQTKFHVCGFCEKEYEGKLEEYAEKNIVIYHGMLRDVRTIIEKTHCTIHPTYYPEGMSNVLLESSACARPIITTDRSGCREIVDDGKNGYMIKQKDTNSLICAIEKFIALPYDERKAMGISGRAKVEAEFDRNIVVKKYMDEVNMI